MKTTKIKNNLSTILFILITVFIYSCDKSDDNPQENSEIPECIQTMLDVDDLNYVSLSSFEWNGEVYYYFYSQCCDFYNDLYDEDCNYVCSPDGGIHGGGDGQCPNFRQESCCEVVLWEL